MSIGLLPRNAGSTATAVAVLADELAFLGGDRSTDLAWYGKRGIIAGMYASTGDGSTESRISRLSQGAPLPPVAMFVM